MDIICRASNCNKELTEPGIRVEAGTYLITQELAGVERDDGPSREPILIASAASKENNKESSAPIGKDIGIKGSTVGLSVTTICEVAPAD